MFDEDQILDELLEYFYVVDNNIYWSFIEETPIDRKLADSILYYKNMQEGSQCLNSKESL